MNLKITCLVPILLKMFLFVLTFKSLNCILTFEKVTKLGYFKKKLITVLICHMSICSFIIIFIFILQKFCWHVSCL